MKLPSRPRATKERSLGELDSGVAKLQWDYNKGNITWLLAIASGMTVWPATHSDCCTRRGVLFFLLRVGIFFSLFLNCQLEKWLTLHLPGQYFTHGCVSTAHPPLLSTNIWRVNVNSSQCAMTPRQWCNVGIIREDCQKVKEPRWGEEWAAWAHYWKFKTHAHTVNCLQQTENDSLCVL